MKQLFKCTTARLQEFYVVAENWLEAADYLQEVLDRNDYGFSSYRKVIKIELIAVENLSEDKQYFFDDVPGHLLINKN